MKPSLEVLKLRAVVAGLEVQIAEQRMEFESLIREARTLLIAQGKCYDITERFGQHGWLDKVNKLFPPDPEEKLLVKDVGWVSGAHGVTIVPRKIHSVSTFVVGQEYCLYDLDLYSPREEVVVVTSIGPVIMESYNVCWRVR